MDLHHQEGVILYGRLKDLAREFAPLYFAWCNNGVLREPLERCDHKKYRVWDCCDLHRGLRREHTAFTKIAEAFSIQGSGQILSQQWLVDLAHQYSFQLPNENRPTWWKDKQVQPSAS